MNVERTLVTFLAGTLAGAAVVTGTTAVAQDQGAAPPGLHPIVGSWAAPAGPYLFTFVADGNLVGVDADGRTYLGSWQASGSERPVPGDTVSLSMQTLLGRGGEGIDAVIAVGPAPDEFVFEGQPLSPIVPESTVTAGTPLP